MRPGQRVGPFDIDKQLGAGAMGVVYRARYRKTGQKVAIKVMHLGGNEIAFARFEREAEVLKQLNHPNIVRFYIASRHEDAPYYAMEYIEGESLDALLSRRGRLTWEEVVEYGKQICAALQHAHDQGIIHRDLKPSNLMMMPDGKLKLTDFGIAKDLDVTQLTSANCTVGTASYMSPEQCKGERNLSHKSDLYSLGVLLYELLTGEKPFKAETTMDMFLMHVQGSFERPSRKVLETPVWLDNLICQLLEKKPEQRPYDAQMVARGLDQVAEKVMAQQSAGIDAVKARVGDRGRTATTGIDKTDRAAARTLMSRGRRRARQEKRFFQQTWFQAIGMLLALAGIAGILYMAFRPPSAEVLYAQAESLMKSADTQERESALKGPIDQFLRHYPERSDDKANQIRAWRDELLLQSRWRVLSNPKARNLAEGEAAASARSAVVEEENGNLSRARDHWTLIVVYKNKQDVDERGWGLLADKRIHAIDSAEEVERILPIKLNEARNTHKILPTDDELVNLAGEAVLHERDFQDVRAARMRWARLKLRTEKDWSRQDLCLLATKKLRSLADEPNDEKWNGELAKALDDHLAVARKEAMANVTSACYEVQEIKHLYGDAQLFPFMNELARAKVKEAERLAEQYCDQPATGGNGSPDR